MCDVRCDRIGLKRDFFFLDIILLMTNCYFVGDNCLEQNRSKLNSVGAFGSGSGRVGGAVEPGGACAVGGKGARKRGAMPRGEDIELDASAWNDGRCAGGLTRGLRERRQAADGR